MAFSCSNINNFRFSYLYLIAKNGSLPRDQVYPLAGGQACDRGEVEQAGRAQDRHLWLHPWTGNRMLLNISLCRRYHVFALQPII